MPLIMSFTMVWAARPMATPATPAEASSGVGLKSKTVAQDADDGKEADDAETGGAQHRGQGANLRRTGQAAAGVPLGSPLHAVGDELHQPEGDPGEDQDGDQVLRSLTRKSCTLS